jgi:hypothetical protein
LVICRRARSSVIIDDRCADASVLVLALTASACGGSAGVDAGLDASGYDSGTFDASITDADRRGLGPGGDAGSTPGSTPVSDAGVLAGGSRAPAASSTADPSPDPFWFDNAMFFAERWRSDPVGVSAGAQDPREARPAAALATRAFAFEVLHRCEGGAHQVGDRIVYDTPGARSILVPSTGCRSGSTSARRHRHCCVRAGPHDEVTAEELLVRKLRASRGTMYVSAADRG